ncbi:ATP/GTP-binding protein [Streptomyces sp. NPDC051214]|uniref:ATP/GTP-binding protein n=1 Tax=Streptomyces sp. NPDC051214 TaxID=3155282 RepID=UPI0034150746
MDPQPPKGSYLWDGQTGGAVYERTCRYTADAAVPAIPMPFWAADEPPPVDPEVLAQEAVDKMNLIGPAIASPRAVGKYTVGVPMWMWVNPSPTTFGPNTATATAGNVTVSATAKVSSIRWSMGDETTVACQGPGTKYKLSYGMSKSPDCGHFYRTSSKDQAGGRFKGTATATWAVEWQVTGGGGEQGAFTEIRESDFEVSVGEMRVLD